MTTTSFELDKFDSETNFNLRQVRMMAILVQTGLKKVVTGKKPENLNQIEWEELDEKALSANQLCLVNTVLQEILIEKTLSALREKCMTISLKKGSVLAVGFEKLGHCVRENPTQVSFNLAVHKSKARSLPASKHKFNSVNFLHSSR
ncbi:hypothetical protein Gotur_018537, partial [Gossypium turneri]